MCVRSGFPVGMVLVLVALSVTGVGGCRRESPVDPAKRIAEGWSWYRSGDFGLAITAFEAALTSVGTNVGLRQRALYGLASTWNLRRPDDDPERATLYYHEVIDADPKSDLAAWSTLAMARMRTLPVAGESVDLKEQVKAYQAVIDAYAAHPAGEEAFVFQQAARLSDAQAGEEQATLAALEEYLKAHPQTPWRAAIDRLIAHCCEVLDLKEQRLAATIEEWQTSEASRLKAADAPPTQDRSFIYWRLATLEEFEEGDFDRAREYYRKLIADYPTEQRVFLAKQELKRMDELEAKVRGEGAGK